MYLILTSLAQGPQHGYAIIQDVASLSGGRVRLSTGTLYGALHRMLDAGWIERFETGDTSREKVSYRLCPPGRERLRADVERLRSLSRVAGARLKMKEA